MDVVSMEQRSRIMRAVRQSGTSPELVVRRLVWRLGARYRTRNRDLPGSPDLANRSGRWAIFVNGCFWHGHKNCSKTKSGRTYRIPEQNADYWQSKLSENRKRDARNCRALRARGFATIIIWECALREPITVAVRLERLLPRRP